MTRTGPLAGLTAAIGLALAPAAAVAAPRATPGYVFTQVDRPGATSTFLATIADDGTAVGAWTDAAGRSHGLLRTARGTLRTIDVPRAAATYALGINASGAIAGTYTDASGHQHGFVKAGARVRRIDVGPAVFTTAVSEFGPGVGTSVGTIADDGTLTGTWGDAKGATHGFVLHPDGQRTDLTAPGASTASDPVFHAVGGTVAIRSNARGQTVGSYVPRARSTTNPVDLRAYVRTRGVFKTLLPAGATTSQAFGLDEHGTVTGVAVGASGGRGFLWRAGRFTMIDPVANVPLATVAGLNAHGAIAGEIVTADGVTHGYVGVPVARTG